MAKAVQEELENFERQLFVLRPTLDSVKAVLKLLCDAMPPSARTTEPCNWLHEWSQGNNLGFFTPATLESYYTSETLLTEAVLANDFGLAFEPCLNEHLTAQQQRLVVERRRAEVKHLQELAEVGHDCLVTLARYHSRIAASGLSPREFIAARVYDQEYANRRKKTRALLQELGFPLL